MAARICALKMALKLNMKKSDKNKAEDDVADLSFESALQELETVAEKLETGRVPLEESLQLLKRGTALIERCESELNGAEAVLEQLIVSSDGELEAVAIASEYEDDEE